MSVGVSLLVATAVLAGVTTLTGRLLIGALRVTWLRRGTPENFALSAWFGTGLWMLGFGWGSHLGLESGRAVHVPLVLTAVLVGVWLIRGERRCLSPSGRQAWGCWLAIAVTGAGLFLVPVLCWGGFDAFNDTYLYAQLTEWIDRHGFGTPCALDPDHRTHCPVVLFQMNGIRMGPVFLMAALRQAVPGGTALEVFLPVAAWGLILNLAGVLLLARWALRLPRPYAAVGAAVAALSLNPLWTAGREGFLPQLFGSAGLAFGVALLTRLLAERRRGSAEALLLGLSIAALATGYSDHVPIFLLLGATTVAVLVVVLPRPAWGRLARFLLLAGAATVLFANVEVERTLRAVRAHSRPHRVGRALPWSAAELSAFALGARSAAAPLNASRGIVALTAAAAAAIGLMACLRLRRAPFVAALAVFAALAVYTTLFVRDPWTGQVGHSFAQFRLAQWAFPFVVALQMVGVQRLAHRLPARWVGLALVAVVAVVNVPAQLREARDGAVLMRGLFRSQNGLEACRDLQHRLGEYAAVYVLDGPKDWRQIWLPALGYPVPFRNDWVDATPFPLPARSGGPPPFSPTPGLLSLVSEDRVLGGRLTERLAGGFAVPDLTAPLIFSSARREDGIGPAPTVWTVWSPVTGVALLKLEAESERPQRLELSGPGGPVCADHPGGTATMTFPLELTAGMTRFEVCSRRAGSLRITRAALINTIR